MRKNAYTRFYSNPYFWRTYDGEEIDFIEEQDGQLHGFEIKWTTEKSAKAPKA